MDSTLIKNSVERYKREYDRYKKLADIVYQICAEIVYKKLTIRATVQRRAKDPDSLSDKLKKYQEITTIDEAFGKISDLAGVRIITYLESDRQLVVDEICKYFAGKREDGIPEVEVKDKQGAAMHYRATHCQVLLPDEYIVGDNKNLRDTTCEIQVCSLLAHAFNEIEHDLQYKPKSGEISDEEKELLDQLGLITKSGDITIKHILDAADERLKEKSGDFDDVHDFVIRMREQLKLGKSFSSNAGQLYDEFRNMNLTSPQAIISALFSGSESIIDVSNSEYTKLKDFLPKYNPDITLDDDSSDILLCSFLRISYKKIIENHPTGRGKGRPSRLLSIAKAYKEMIEQK